VLQRSSSDDVYNVLELRRRRRLHDDDGDGGNCVATSGESSGKIGHLEIRKPASYVYLYDEQLIENNVRCYMQ